MIPPFLNRENNFIVMRVNIYFKKWYQNEIGAPATQVFQNVTSIHYTFSEHSTEKDNKGFTIKPTTVRVELTYDGGKTSIPMDAIEKAEIVKFNLLLENPKDR